MDDAVPVIVVLWTSKQKIHDLYCKEMWQ